MSRLKQMMTQMKGPNKYGHDKLVKMLWGIRTCAGQIILPPSYLLSIPP